MATLPHSPSYFRSIVKKLHVDYSDEPGMDQWKCNNHETHCSFLFSKDFTFDDEGGEPTTATKKTDASTQTLAMEPQDRSNSLLINSRNVFQSSDRLYQRSTMYNSLSPMTRCRNKQFSRDALFSSSKSRNLPTSESCPVPLGYRRSQSVGQLLSNQLHVKLTDDSGTGDSLDPLPLRAMSKHYESVPIYEQDISALISNRYDFVQSKVDEYRRRKHGNRSALPSLIPAEIPSLKFGRHHTRRPGMRPPSATGSTKSTNLLSRVMKIFKSSWLLGHTTELEREILDDGAFFTSLPFSVQVVRLLSTHVCSISSLHRRLPSIKADNREGHQTCMLRVPNPCNKPVRIYLALVLFCCRNDVYRGRPVDERIETIYWMPIGLTFCFRTSYMTTQQ